MCLGQIVALIIVNKCMKFQEICLSTLKFIAKVKVCHDDNNKNENNDYPAADNTRVMTTPPLTTPE